METKEVLLKEIEEKILELKENHKLSFKEVIQIVKKREDEKKKTIPLSIFDNDSLSSLQAITKYLKENQRLEYAVIANILNRTYDCIAITYRNAKRKYSPVLDDDSPKKIPLNVFKDIRLSVLETIVSYLKEELNMTYHDIALAMRRDDRTIWTVHKRSKDKRKK